MGSGASKGIEEPIRDIKEVSLKRDKVWHDTDAEMNQQQSMVYQSNPLYTELRTMLNEPVGQRFLGEFAKSETSQENFFAWIDMQEFKGIPTKDFRRCVAKSIFQKYIKEGAIMQLGCMTKEIIDKYEMDIYGELRKDDESDDVLLVKPGRNDLEPDLFIHLQHTIFREMAVNTFKRFKSSDLYQDYLKVKKKSYNTVDVSDFDYMAYIGKGAFGVVAHVRKQSTRKHYAMKVMSKGQMVKSVGRRDSAEKREERLLIERNVCAQSKMPFLVAMHYAFQTEKDAIIVMEYVRGGTLQDLIKKYPKFQMPQEHIAFIIAEMSLALRHLHCMNYVHRDIKPINILIGSDGHIKLADMGLVSKIDDNKAIVTNPLMEDVLEQEIEEEALLDQQQPSIDPTTESKIEEGNEDEEEGEGSPNNKPSNFVGRRYTRVGTMGYKAPELLNARRPQRKKDKEEAKGEAVEEEAPRSYGDSVDWWSLGVLALEMFCGKNHFALKNLNPLGKASTTKQELDQISNLNEPTRLIPSDSDADEHARSFIGGLLHMDPEKRLGTNEAGFQGIRDHPFLSHLNFQKLLAKKIDPPYRVDDVAVKLKDPRWPTYDQMKLELDSADLQALMGEESAVEVIRDKDQKYFNNWDYVAAETFKLELERQRKRMETSVAAAPKEQQQQGS
mmetsp:Transcript_28268/g.45557  ORF Transcript_28268/g.45557 Transcript_28268/m.45557 type:complete len:670 (+) Transcript_28268:2936-4945(+)